MPAPVSVYDDPELYDRLMPPGPCEGFYRAQALDAGPTVLELACGTGRLAIPLALSGLDVTGVDVSDVMLRTARAKAAAAGARCTFVRGDMRGFDLGRTFTTVLLTGNSLAHLASDDDLRSCLSSIRRHLDPGGCLVLDTVNPDPERLVRAASQEVVRRPRAPGFVRLREHLRFDAERRIASVAFSGETADGPFASIPLHLRMYAPDELDRALDEAGFTLKTRLGGFGGQPFRKRSPHQVVMAEAPPRHVIERRAA